MTVKTALAAFLLTALLILPAPARSEAASAAQAEPAAASASETPGPDGIPDASGPQDRVLVVRPGGTLIGLLESAGADSADAHAAIAALGDRFRPSALHPGDEVAIRLSAEDAPQLLELELEPAPGHTLRASRQPDGSWTARETFAERTRFVVRAEGRVDGGLFPAMTRAGVPAGLSLSLIRVLGHEVDFQRDLQPGDRFAVLFERYRDGEGEVLGHGQVLHAELTLSGRRLAVWRHRNRAGTTDWYDAEGRSLRRTFLRTPLDGARISSGFGRRSHPVLGYNRMHQGIDFAAPAGTPIYAAADGVVISARREGGYGNMVRLRHANGTITHYAHMSRFGRGIAAGRRVRQGDVIGAVGSTGLSTGPHLHYEIVMNNQRVDPARQIHQTVRLAGRDLATFRTAQRALQRATANLATREEVAMAAD